MSAAALTTLSVPSIAGVQASAGQYCSMIDISTCIKCDQRQTYCACQHTYSNHCPTYAVVTMKGMQGNSNTYAALQSCQYTHCWAHQNIVEQICLPDVLPSLGCYWQPASREPPPAAGFKMGFGLSATCCRPAPSLGAVGPTDHAMQWLMAEELTACLSASHVIKGGGGHAPGHMSGPDKRQTCTHG